MDFCVFLTLVSAALSTVLLPMFFIRREQQRRLVAMEEISNNRCLACSGELVLTHPEAWTCVACGYEQGPGWALHREEEQLQELLAMSPEQAKDRAHQLLRNVRLQLLASIPALEEPLIETANHHHGSNAVTYSYRVNPEVVDAATEVSRSWKDLKQAALIDAEVAAALSEAGVEVRALPPCGDLYERETQPVARAAHVVLPVVYRTQQQVIEVMDRLGVAG